MGAGPGVEAFGGGEVYGVAGDFVEGEGGEHGGTAGAGVCGFGLVFVPVDAAVGGRRVFAGEREVVGVGGEGKVFGIARELVGLEQGDGDPGVVIVVAVGVFGRRVDVEAGKIVIERAIGAECGGVGADLR